MIKITWTKPNWSNWFPNPSKMNPRRINPIKMNPCKTTPSKMSQAAGFLCAGDGDANSGLTAGR